MSRQFESAWCKHATAARPYPASSVVEDGAMTPFENVPVGRFHRRLVISAGSGQFSDGFSIGIIAIALSLAKEPLGLSGWWMGALGASTLFGLFFGSLIAGSITDRYGRRPMFNWGMLLFTIIAVMQYLSPSAQVLFAARFLLGVILACDYVACKAMVTEYSPSRNRGVNLSILALSWTSGYLCSFIAGYVVRSGGPEAWRLALLASAAPSFIAFLLRCRIPESPLWLAHKGRMEEARGVVSKYIGPGISLPAVDQFHVVVSQSAARLFKPPLLKNLVVGCVFYASQVIPLFALGTYLPIVMANLGLGDGYTGALVYNILFWLGALIGPFIIDRMPRRKLLVGGFVVMATLLAILIGWRAAPALVTVSLFAAFAFVLSVAGILQFVYPPELFPTELRARGLGATLAFSRFGTASSTFVLPAVVEGYGVSAALGFCMVVMIFAAVVCYAWAPETLRKPLE
ncbi:MULTISPECIES: MFS transporter [unclassified Sphingobium]|uniref:MFS transporter n=1 Tax=unclassified Sphingobium TaxID=2611147 RepID=UPI0035A6670A